MLVGAGLLARSFAGAMGSDRGFATDDRLVFAVNLPHTSTAARTDEVRERLLDRIASIPRVAAVGCVSTRPLGGNDTGMGIAPAGEVGGAWEKPPWVSWRLASGSYFEAIGVPLLRGRTFTSRDRQEPPAIPVVVSDGLARRLFPGADPIGRRVRLWAGQSDDPGEIVGVVGSMRERGLDADPTPTVYLPFGGDRWTSPEFVVHAAGEPATLVTTMRAMLADIDPTLPISRLRSLDEIVGRALATRRFNMLLMAVLAACALLLALAGIWGVQMHFVASRRAEMGIRMAFGARPAQVVAANVAQGMRPAALGIALGLPVALGLSRLMSRLLFGVTAADAITYAGVAVLLALAALVSCAVPALRALRIDPAVTLRGE